MYTCISKFIQTNTHMCICRCTLVYKGAYVCVLVDRPELIFSEYILCVPNVNLIFSK